MKGKKIWLVVIGAALVGAVGAVDPTLVGPLRVVLGLLLGVEAGLPPLEL